MQFHQNVLKRSYDIILRFIKIVLFILQWPQMAFSRRGPYVISECSDKHLHDCAQAC